MTISITDALPRILPKVKNPGRYLGGEANQVVKDPASVVGSIALVFPDVYELGMSHNGTKVLYHLFNREPDLAAESAFAPMPDMAEQMRKLEIPLYALESYRPVSSFTAIGISLQTELNFTNVPYLLELAGLTAFAKDRADGDSFIIGGGPCMANPEPVADFFDLFVIGDGENLAPQLVRLMGEGRRAGKSKAEILRELSEIRGVYVPSLLDVTQNARGEIVPAVEASQGPFLRAKGIKRHWVEKLDAADYPVTNPIPHMQLVHDRYSIEVMRGCTQGCRFCQAGYWYRPNRELNADDVIDLARKGMDATGERELGLLSLSTADYKPVEKVLDYLVESEEFDGVDLSLPSLRANSYGQGLARKAAALTGGKSATFAPETGSERIRKMINKTISDQDMYDAAEGVFRSGLHNIKLYTMIGFPTENLDDMEAFCGLIRNLNKIGRKYGSRNTVHANIGILVPKPVTPMQWVPFMDEETVAKHIRYVREAFRNVSGVRITWADYGLSLVESFYSRGDRSQSALIYAAYKKDMVFESFSEHFSFAGWKEIWNEAGFDMGRIYDQREMDEVFPWDFIHAGSNKGFLKNEYKKMFKEDAAPVPDCKWGDCQKCGIPGNYADIQLSPDPEKYTAKNRSPEEIAVMAAERRARNASACFSYRMIYRKTGLSRFIAHHSTQELFEKAFRRLRTPLRLSSGFNPRPQLKNTGALPLGLASQKELLIVELAKPLEGDLAMWCTRLTEFLPDGMDVSHLEAVTSSRLPRIENVLYRLPSSIALGEDTFEKAIARFQAGEVAQGVHRDKPMDFHAEALEVYVQDGDLFVRLRTQPSGSTISPYAAYGLLLNMDPELLRMEMLSKEDFNIVEGKSSTTLILENADV